MARNTSKATVLRRLDNIETELLDALNAVQDERKRREASDNVAYLDTYGSKLARLNTKACELHDAITAELG